jgi:hypothetical protein
MIDGGNDPLVIGRRAAKGNREVDAPHEQCVDPLDIGDLIDPVQRLRILDLRNGDGARCTLFQMLRYGRQSVA